MKINYPFSTLPTTRVSGYLNTALIELIQFKLQFPHRKTSFHSYYTKVEVEYINYTTVQVSVPSCGISSLPTAGAWPTDVSAKKCD